MKTLKILILLTVIFLFTTCKNSETVTIEGELMTCHKITLRIPGPYVSENDTPNPFLNYRLNVVFSHAEKEYSVPGYFSADGNAGETGAVSGKIWKVHFTPDRSGKWKYRINFKEGKNIAISSDLDEGESLEFDGYEGELIVKDTDKEGKDFRAKGRVSYTGESYLKHEGSEEYFLKGGANSPENFLAYSGFDGTYYGGRNEQRSGEDSPNLGLHAYEPHIKDWKESDPVWHNSKGKGIIGALNYLASKDMNSVYFLTMNILGDGEDVWPYTDRNERYRFDCSKLDQWEIVFSHMDKLGIMMHVVLQETENECLLDAGYLDVQRKLYLRELVARFSHHLAITWNLGEEHHDAGWAPYGQTVEDTKKMAEYLREIDPYDHFMVIHTLPGYDRRDFYMRQYLGYDYLDGISIQVSNPMNSHSESLKWLKLSADSGHNWVVNVDEIGPYWLGAMPDNVDPAHDTIRENVLWANLMAGGGGVEWYFGYTFPHGDLSCEDWRSRDNLWEQTDIALDFFRKWLPFTEMVNSNELVQKGFCFAKEGNIYAVYVPEAINSELDLRGVEGEFNVKWYNPRVGGDLLEGTVTEISGNQIVNIGNPPYEPEEDWVYLVNAGI